MAAESLGVDRGRGLGLQRAAVDPLVPLVHDRDLIPARVLRAEGLELGAVPVALEVQLALEGGALAEPVAVLPRAHEVVFGGAVAQRDRSDLADRGLEPVAAPHGG